MRKPDESNVELLSLEVLEAHTQFASTLANGLAVLKLFGPGALSLGNKDIAHELELTRPTVSRLTFTLSALGFLRRDVRTGRYSLGPAVLSLGYPLLSGLAIRRVAAASMQELALFAKGAVSLGTRDRLQVVYVETMQGAVASHTKPDIGITRPLLSTAIGHALLYVHPDRERELLFERLALANAGGWDAAMSAYERAAADIEQRGFCMSWGAWDPTLVSVAVPVRAPVEGLPLAFNLTLPTFSVERERFETELAPRLVNLVRNVERQMGYDGGPTGAGSG